MRKLNIKNMGKNIGAKKSEVQIDPAKTIGKSLSFSAAEAYKLLRTNIMFSLPDGSACKLVGITSAMPGEGKTTTAINLAYTLAETGKKVLLLECDLRCPSVAKKLEINGAPGLSNIIAGINTPEETVQTALLDNISIIIAGDIPPNPSELLDSESMRTLVKKFSEQYDFIIFDMPPVNSVSDALIVSKLVDGIALVVRRGVERRQALAEALNQLKFAGTKILGFIMTGGSDRRKKYGYGKYKYKEQ